MRNLILTMLLACAVMAICSCAMATNGPGHNCDAWCDLIPPDETFPLWEYTYTILNYSTDHAITAWTWSYGGYSGDVMPNTHADPKVFGDANWPLAPSSGPGDEDTNWRVETFDDAATPYPVPSVVHFDDDVESFFDIWVPINLVPEPGSALALASGFVGMVGLARRRRA